MVVGRVGVRTRGSHVSRYVHLVFSEPPPGVSDAEYNAWYDEHVKEILRVDGWVSATRYRVDPVVGAGETGGYRYLSRYELDRPPDEAVANLVASGLGDAATYAAVKGDDDPLPVPDWFAEVRFASWNCSQVGDTTSAT
jgi:hypothetical protein